METVDHDALVTMLDRLKLTAIRDHVAPTLRAAAEAVGRPEPQIISSVPVCVTDDPGPALERAGDLNGARIAFQNGFPAIHIPKSKRRISLCFHLETTPCVRDPS